MKSTTAWFTLIEILIAMSIASIALVGVFLLLQSGVRQSGLVREDEEIEQVLASTRSCIMTENIRSLSGTTNAVWVDEGSCHTGAYTPTLSFTGTQIQYYTQDIPSVSKNYPAYFSVNWVQQDEYRIEHTVVGETRRKTITYEAYRK